MNKSLVELFSYTGVLFLIVFTILSNIVSLVGLTSGIRASSVDIPTVRS